jgi:hypothetical protein
MAKKNEILISIALEGDQDIKNRLNSLGEDGQRALKKIEGSVGEAHEGLGKLKEPLGKLKEALAPFLEGAELGGAIEAGGLLGRLFGAAGPAAAIAALGGMAIHLARVAEESQKTQSRLKGFGAGDNGLEKLQDQAKGLGTSVENIRPGLERLLAGRQKLIAQQELAGGISHPPGAEASAEEEKGRAVNIIGRNGAGYVPSREAYTKAHDALFKAARKDSSDSEAIEKAVTQYLETIQQEGSVSPQAIDTLHGFSPNAADLDLSARLQKTGQKSPFQQQITDLGKPDVQAQAEAMAQGARGVSEAFDGLKASAGRLDEVLGKIVGGPAGKALTAGIDAASAGVDKATGFIERSAETIKSDAAAGYDLGSRTGIPLAGYPTGAAGALLGVDHAIVRGIYDALPAFGQNALTNPGAIQEKARPATGPHALLPRQPAPEGFQKNLYGGGEWLIKQENEEEKKRREEEERRREEEAESQGFAAGGLVGRFADGGSVNPSANSTDLGLGSYNIVATDDGGADINGVHYPPGSPILDNPIVQAALQRSRAGRDDPEERMRQATRHHSDFVGKFGSDNFYDDAKSDFADGGSIRGPGTSTSDSIPAMLSHGEYVVRARAVSHYGTSFMNKLNRMGFAKGGFVELPHFADGGGISLPSLGRAPSIGGVGEAAGGAGGHYTVDLRTNHGDFSMLASGEVARKMSQAARDSVNAQTGARPSWYKGR